MVETLELIQPAAAAVVVDRQDLRAVLLPEPTGVLEVTMAAVAAAPYLVLLPQRALGAMAEGEPAEVMQAVAP